MLTITITVDNPDQSDDAEETIEESHDLPSKFEVCDDCEGHGSVLNESMRNHAYTAEEFAEAFDEEEAAEYSRHGGRYDVKCPTCQGKNVVSVVDTDHLSPEQAKVFAIWEEQGAEEAREREYDRRTYLMECGGYG